MKSIAGCLIEWYRRSGRTYAWRRRSTPYEILVAEIMLQRTKADQVESVYLSFIKRFPDPQKLCKARRNEIEGYFAKLGLRWRANSIRSLACELVERYNGNIPRDRKTLLSLPSVGDYIADALLTFAYGENVAVVDANVCRIIGRIFGLKPKGEARRDIRFRKLAQSVLPEGAANEFNWAMIDLAALVCIPRIPRCSECPIVEYCNYGKRIHSALALSHIDPKD